MKLQQISEQSVEPNALLSIRNVMMKGGKHRNTFELIVLCRFLQLFKDGVFHCEANPLFTASISTNQEMLNHLRSMPDADLGALAGKVYGMLNVPTTNYQASNCYGCPQMSYLAWMQLFQAREATD